MVLDFILAVFAGIATQSFIVFASLFIQPDRPYSSDLMKLALMAFSISPLFSLFGGGGNCDCDL